MLMHNGARRRILVASYHFPPDAAVGALRIARFVRLLPEFGWDPTVLTLDDAQREDGLDESRLRGLEAIPVIKTRALPRLVDILRRMRALVGGQRSATNAAGAGTAAGTIDRTESLRSRLKRYAVSLLVFLPDERKNWSLRAAIPGALLIRRRRIDWVFTSGPPFSVHVIGVVAKLVTRARWVADFRDPWIDMLPERFPHIRSALSDWLERRMEATVVRCADRVVTTTARMRDAMTVRYPHVSADKFVVIPNGIDRERIRPERTSTYDTFTITYAGTLYFDRTPEPLFRAVGDLIRSGRISTRDIRIKLLGQCRQIEGVDTHAVAARYGVEDVVEVIDRVPYAEALGIMQRSHLLLMLAPTRHRLVVPAKIFDYLGSGSSILAIAEPGATADLIADTQCGRCFRSSDDEGIREYVAGLLVDGAYRHLGNDPAAFARYDARRLTERLVAGMTGVGTASFEGVAART